MSKHTCDSCGKDCNGLASGISIPSLKINHTIIVCTACLSLAQQVLASTRMTEELKNLSFGQQKLIRGGVCLQSVNTSSFFVKSYEDKKLRKIG